MHSFLLKKKKSRNFSDNFHLSFNVIPCPCQHFDILVVLQSFLLNINYEVP